MKSQARGKTTAEEKPTFSGRLLWPGPEEGWGLPGEESGAQCLPAGGKLARGGDCLSHQTS